MAVFTVTLSGGGPWGLRLFGGHNDPLIIARLRKRSKAEEAGLQENDELVSINGQPCSSMSHATAMSTLENSSHLTLEVARAGGGHAAASAVPSLGPAAPASGGGGSRVSSAVLQLQTPPSPGMLNGAPNIHSYQTDDGGMHTVKEQTSQEQFGSSSLTKVSREVTSNWGPPRIDTQGPQGLFSPAPSPGGSSPYQLAPSPSELFSPGGAPPAQYQQPQQNYPAGPQGPPAPQGPSPYHGASPYQVPSPRQMFSPNPQQNAAPQQQPVMFKNPGQQTGRPNVWQPGAGSAQQAPSAGPSVPPPQKPLPSIGPKFNVRSVSTVTKQEAYGTWAPGGKGGPPKVSPRPMTPPRDEPATSGPGTWQPSGAKFRDIVDTGPKEPVNKAPPSQPSPSPFANGAPYNNYAPPPNNYGATNGFGNTSDSPIYDSDLRYPTNPDTLPNVDLNRLIMEGSSDGSGMNTPTRKKKIFADSAFYDDPQHKYPTIEEQIKMARKVAMSLTSPANTTARGHQMFNKRREKAEGWTAGMDGQEEIYYNPDPWQKRQGPHTWQPDPSQPSYGGPSAPTPLPPSNLDRWMAPSYKDYGEKEDKAGALSQDEFERMRLYEQKTLHNTVSPQVCFNLANDLRNAKGKAGAMFAKRRAKADEHVIDESNVRGGPDPNIMAKLLEGRAPPPAPKADRPDNSKTDVFVKPEVSPWEAALGGSVDSAFNHLSKGWAAGSAPGMGTPVPDKYNTPSTVKLEQGGGISPLDVQNFNRRARGWGAIGGGAPAAAPSPQPPQQQQWPAPQQQPPQQWGGGASAPAAPQWGNGAGAAAPPQQQYGGAPAQPYGFSDL